MRQCPTPTGGSREAPSGEELAEIKKLRKEAADQQRTIEILKAAATFFVQEASPRSPRPLAGGGDVPGDRPFGAHLSPPQVPAAQRPGTP